MNRLDNCNCGEESRGIEMTKKCPKCNSDDTKYEVGGVFSCNKCGKYWKGRNQ